MKYLILLLLVVFSSHLSAAKYEESLREMAQDLAHLVEKRGFEKIAIWNFESINQRQDYISKPLTEDFSVHFTNATHSLKIYDRQHLASLSEELTLQQSGLIAPQTAKEIGSFTGVEAIVIGNYAVNKNKVKLWIKVIETESAFQIAMKNALLPLQRKQYLTKKDAERKPAQAKLKAVPLGKGKIRFINNKATHLKLVLTKGDFKRELKVGSKSIIEAHNLPKGVYSCEIYFHSGDLFQKFDIDVKNKLKRVRIRAQSIFSMWY